MSKFSGEIRALRNSSRLDSLVVLGCFGLAALVCCSWIAGGFDFTSLYAPERLKNVERFFREIVPYPLQGKPFDLAVLWSWVCERMQKSGAQGLAATFWISVLAIVFSQFLCLPFAVFASRTLASSSPFRSLGKTRNSLVWKSVVFFSRFILIFFRALPEYVLAFVLLSVFGPGALPAILALGIHNAGILGKLNAELIEGLPMQPLAALRDIGASRSQVALFAVVPTLFNPSLALFLYRWETCVRESTVLGLLGVASLGYWIEDSRSRNFHDEMFFFIMLGAVIVLAGDLVSNLTRKYLRKN